MDDFAADFAQGTDGGLFAPEIEELVKGFIVAGGARSAVSPLSAGGGITPAAVAHIKRAGMAFSDGLDTPPVHRAGVVSFFSQAR